MAALQLKSQEVQEVLEKMVEEALLPHLSSVVRPAARSLVVVPQSLADRPISQSLVDQQPLSSSSIRPSSLLPLPGPLRQH